MKDRTNKRTDGQTNRHGQTSDDGNIASCMRR